MKLTKEQTKIIAHEQGSAIIEAGPGTGKTQTLCLTIKQLVNRGCCPENIQVLTFSKKANNNFKDRLGVSGHIGTGGQRVKTNRFIY